MRKKLHRWAARFWWWVGYHAAAFAKAHDRAASGLTEERIAALPYDFRGNSYWHTLMRDDAFNAALSAICEEEIRLCVNDMEGFVRAQNLPKATGASAAIAVFQELGGVFQKYANLWQKPRLVRK